MCAYNRPKHVKTVEVKFIFLWILLNTYINAHYLKNLSQGFSALILQSVSASNKNFQCKRFTLLFTAIIAIQ